MNWLLYGILGVISAGASYAFAKGGMHKSSSNLAAALRGTFLFLSALFMVKETGTDMALTQIGQTNLIYLLASGVATGALWICLLRALQLGEIIKVVPILEGSVILNILVGVFFFHDGVSFNTIMILTVLIAGVIMMGLKGVGRGGRRGSWLGYAAGAMALTTVTSILERVGISGIHSNYERLVRYGVALVVVWGVAFSTSGYRGLRMMSFLDGVYLCLSGVCMGGFWYCMHQAYVLGVNENVAFVERFDLVAAVVLGCVFMRERMTIRSVLGMIFMMLGFWLLLADLPIIPL